MSATLLEEIREIQSRLDFHKLAKAAANGEDVSATDVIEACRLAGHTPEQFAGVVSSIQRRVEMRAEYKTLGSVKQQIADLRAQVDAENAALEAAVAAHQAATGPLQEEIETTTTEMNRIAAIPHQLFDGCPNGALKEKYLRGEAHKHNREIPYHGAEQAALREQIINY